MVLLDASDIWVNRASRKFAALCLGPFKVIEAVGKGAYRLELPPSLARLHPVFPVVKLFPLPNDPFPGRVKTDHPIHYLLTARSTMKWRKSLTRVSGIGEQSILSSGQGTMTLITNGYHGTIWMQMSSLRNSTETTHKQNSATNGLPGRQALKGG